MTKDVEKFWLELSEKEQEEYIEISKMASEVVKMDRMEIDETVVELRPGNRSYNGHDIEIELTENEKDQLEKISFNPIYW
ncbi:hypothetical protein DAPPUDRAFT_321549 [Daphnia pulex]|uniref:HMG box domain-containing protein n=1 Tax=Daphnia pulex TaxID=6669 RepID=E9GSZ7_DAPPU|nr:hypothetical protein DAPPUDRAFT_321549 [Daphnia pulex]|eukprot:EFX77279.1 hypothetical protein DAPPUDRAFT_321549 [Daphnia pulex]